MTGRHWLTVDGEDIGIEHEDCPLIPGRYSDPEHPYTEHDCWAEAMAAEMGLPYWLGIDIGGPIPDGRWELRLWTSRTPTDYGTGVEYDAGMELVDDPRCPL